MNLYYRYRYNLFLNNKIRNPFRYCSHNQIWECIYECNKDLETLITPRKSLHKGMHITSILLMKHSKNKRNIKIIRPQWHPWSCLSISKLQRRSQATNFSIKTYLFHAPLSKSENVLEDEGKIKPKCKWILEIKTWVLKKSSY